MPDPHGDLVQQVGLQKWQRSMGYRRWNVTVCTARDSRAVSWRVKPRPNAWQQACYTPCEALMLYLLQVYTIVVVAVSLSIVLLFLAVTALRLAFTAIRFMIRTAKTRPAVRVGVSREHWSFIHR
jgi:hypothetical protein